MEEDIFPSGAVAPVLEEQYIEARLHTDGEANIERILELQAELTNSLANPYYVLQHPDFAEALDTLSGYAGEETFARFLKDAVPTDKVGAAF
ncbi:MAG: hypothetical protein AAF682_10495 [Planctomycetota bacterium]